MAIAAILAGLAYFAMTNLVHRTKYSRVVEEHRLIARALQNYSLDFAAIPAASQGFSPLLRPTVYLGSLPRDPFQTGPNSSYLYVVPNSPEIAAVIISPGPDGRFHLPGPLWEYAGITHIDSNMLPPVVVASREREMLERQHKFIPSPGRPDMPASSAQRPRGAFGRPGVMTESDLAMLHTYINLAQYNPDTGGSGDIITLVYY